MLAWFLMFRFFFVCRPSLRTTINIELLLRVGIHGCGHITLGCSYGKLKIHGQVYVVRCMITF